MQWLVKHLGRRGPSRRAELAHTLISESKRSFWAMADQAIVSLGNFGLNIVLARYFEHQHHLAGYGAFWVLMELMFFFNGIQGALVAYPLTVRGAVVDAVELGKLTNLSLWLTLIGAPVMIGGVFLTGLVIHLPAEVGIWAGVALASWQLQETTRRALMAHLRFLAACAGDALSYLGQLVVVILLAYTGELDLARTFQAIALTSAVGCLIQVWQIVPRRTRLREIIEHARTCWGLGQWLLLGNLTTLLTGTFYNWNIAYWAGLEKLGVYHALFNLVRPAHPLAFAMATLVTPQAAQARSTENVRAAKMVSLRLSMLGLLMLAPYLGLLLLAPRTSVAIAYGWDSGYLDYALLVQLAAIAVTFMFIATVAGAFLNGVEHTRQSFLGQAAYAAAFVLIAMPCTAFFGLQGALWGRVIASMLSAAVNLRFISMLQDTPTPERAQAAQP